MRPALAPCYPTGQQRGFGGPPRKSGGSVQAADKIATAVGGLARAIDKYANDKRMICARFGSHCANLGAATVPQSVRVHGECSVDERRRQWYWRRRCRGSYTLNMAS